LYVLGELLEEFGVSVFVGFGGFGFLFFGVVCAVGGYFAYELVVFMDCLVCLL